MKRVPVAPPPPPPGADRPKAKTPTAVQREIAPTDPFAPPRETPRAPKPRATPVPTVRASDTPHLASRGDRFFAAWIDGVVAFVGALPGGLGVLLTDGILENLSLIVALLGMLAASAYQWRLLANTGQSVGKQMRGIRVERIDGSPPSFWNMVVLRVWIPGALQSIPGAAILSTIDVLFIFSADCRCLHDHLAGTRVVEA